MLAVGTDAFATERETEPVPTSSPERQKYGQFYDLKRYDECRRKDPRNSRCEIYRLVRQENPEHWPNSSIAKPKWPDPPKETVYRRGMSGVEYWRALCKAEAGEFIYRTAESVSSVYQIRPRAEEPGHALGDKYVMEDPYGYGQGDDGWRVFATFVWRTDLERKKDTPYFKYLAFERPVVTHDIRDFEAKNWHPTMSQPPREGAKYQFYYLESLEHNIMKHYVVEYLTRVRSRYGYTWRGISRSHDRELGVAGGELMVVDLETGEILGLRRGFILARTSKDGRYSWFSPNACPEYARQEGYRGRNKDVDSVLWFLTKVLEPKRGQLWKAER